MESETMRQWNIADMDDNLLDRIEAHDEVQALSKFFESRGYSPVVDLDELSEVHGRVHAPFENLEVMVY
jgi:hypothetical protein